VNRQLNKNLNKHEPKRQAVQLCTKVQMTVHSSQCYHKLFGLNPYLT